uniref:Uncharacterized protein n=1 Tax=Odontella aurita TaxID=265563 RepID=A0A7S4HQ09_9STRA
MNAAPVPIPGVAAVASSTTEDMIQCRRCSYPGCDVRVTGCGCSLHSRCIPFPPTLPMTHCPHCNRPSEGLVLYAMSFREIDEARRAAAANPNSGKRSRKRKDPSRQDDGRDHDKFDDPAGLRTGRWTGEEMSYTDELIAKFTSGQLPLVEGIKLNDFLASMLKSKQSRLTKKMKNANLSSKSFKRTTGYIANVQDAQEFSRFEDAFLRSIQSERERAEIRFHIQKEWRELFSSFCVSIGQTLDADAWLSSVEEMDRRASQAKEVARSARRKLMMGYALSQDIQNPDNGVFIERSASGGRSVGSHDHSDSDPGGPRVGGGANGRKSVNAANAERLRNYQHASPFLSKVVGYLKKCGVPFEHVDAWVPSFVPGEGGTVGGNNADSKCRLCFAGFATGDYLVRSGLNGNSSQSLAMEDQFSLVAFGEYSQKFSFNVGCGLPGRVYQSGVPTWEQSVQNAPHHHFERCGGALQWGIKTVVGLPIPSPNVGRIVLVLYSREDREKDQQLVGKLCEEFSKFMPTPKWKLVVDIGKPAAPVPAVEQQQSAPAAAGQPSAPAGQATGPGGAKDPRVDELVSLLGEHMPSDPSSPFASYMQGFMSLRLMLLRSSRTREDEDIVQTLLSSYSSYSAAGRTKSDIAAMLARDFLFLQQQQPQVQVQAPPPQQIQQAPPPPQQVPQAQLPQQHQQVMPVPAPAHAHGGQAPSPVQWQTGGPVAPAAAPVAGQNSSSWQHYAQQGMPPS